MDNTVIFNYKTYRCEWQIVRYHVDQYGHIMYDQQFVVLESFSSQLEAKENLSKYAVEHEFVKGRYLPINYKGGFMEVDIRYKEVCINEYAG